MSITTTSWVLMLYVVIHFLLCGCHALSDSPSPGNLLTRLKRQFEEVPEAEPGNANGFFDELLNNTRQFMVERGLEPLKVGQIEICSDCVIGGLSTVKRTGDITLSQKGDDIVVDVNIGFTLIRGSCYCVKKLLVSSIRGHLKIIMKNMAVHTKLRIQLSPEIKPNVEEFDVTNPGELDLFWDGRGILGNLIEPFFFLFRHKIARVVQRFLPALLKSVISNNIGRFSQFIDL